MRRQTSQAPQPRAGRDPTVERDRQPERGAPLADAGRPLEDVGVGDAAACDGALERRPRQILADEVSEPHRRNLTHAIAGRARRRGRSTGTSGNANIDNGMGILGRLSTLIKSNVNDAIDGMQDPAKEIDQMVRDMEDYAAPGARRGRPCMGDEKRLLERRLQTLDGEINDVAASAPRRPCARATTALAKEALRPRDREGGRAAPRRKKALQEQGVYVDQLDDGAQGARGARQGRQAAPGHAAREGARRQGRLAAARARPRRSTTSSACRASIDAVEAEAGLADELEGRTAASVAAERKLNEMASRQLGRRRPGRAQTQARQNRLVSAGAGAAMVGCAGYGQSAVCADRRAGRCT